MIHRQKEGNATLQIRGKGPQKEGNKRRARRRVGERVERVNKRIRGKDENELTQHFI